MKKLITTLAMLSIASGVFAQGQVNWANSTSGISTNSVPSPFSAYGGTLGGAGKTSAAANGFYYTLFFDTTTIPANNDPLTAGWTQVTVGGTPVVGTNYNLAAGDMVGPAGSGTMLPDNWAAGQAGKFIIVGWSANLGTTWSTVSGELADTWNSIPGFNFANYYWFGVSAIGTATPTASPSPATQLWPLAGNTFVLEEVGPVVPEPGTLALAALGGATLLLFRRKK